MKTLEDLSKENNEQLRSMLMDLVMQFASKNNIPVEKVRICRHDFREIYKCPVMDIFFIDGKKAFIPVSIDDEILEMFDIDLDAIEQSINKTLKGK